MSVDAMDLVRRFYDAVNRSDAAAVAALYHPACIVEYVFTDDAQVHEGLAEVRARWAAEFARFAGAGPGGRRVEVCTVEGEILLLCWKLGEEKITHWHNTSEGFAGRKPIDDRIANAGKKRK